MEGVEWVLVEVKVEILCEWWVFEGVGNDLLLLEIEFCVWCCCLKVRIGWEGWNEKIDKVVVLLGIDWVFDLCEGRDVG